MMGTTMRVVMANRSLKRQVIMAATVWAFCATMAVVTVLAQGDTSAAAVDTKGWLDRWATPQNIVSAAVLVYGLGVLREQFTQVRRELDSVKAELKKFREVDAPDTYVRRDVLDAELRDLKRPVAH